MTANAFARNGFTFVGWNTSSTATTATYEDEEEVTNLSTGATIILYAIWNANYVDVTFDLNVDFGDTAVTFNGTSYANDTTKPVMYVKYDLTYESLKTSKDATAAVGLLSPSRTGYTFKGWYKEETLTNQITKTDAVWTYEAHTLYAKWEANTYTNTIEHYVSRGRVGSGEPNYGKFETTTFSVVYGQKYTLDTDKAVTIPNGYVLGAQVYRVNDTTYLNLGTTEYTQIATGLRLFYYYYPTTYTITYTMNGGTNNNANPSSYNVLYGVTFGAPTKTGYTFDGWYIGNTQVTGINPGADASFATNRRSRPMLTTAPAMRNLVGFFESPAARRIPEAML